MRVSPITGAYSLASIKNQANVAKMPVNTVPSTHYGESKISYLPYVNIIPAISFGQNGVKNGDKIPVNVSLDIAKEVANSLSTSTSGHRAIYNSETFTPDVVRLMTLGVAEYARDHAPEGKRPTVLIGGDTREATVKSLSLVKKTLEQSGVHVIQIKKPVSTPLLAIAAREYDVDLAILMTASHNEWEYGGFNLVTKNAAIAPAKVTKEVGENIVKIAERGYYIINKTSENIYPYTLYKRELNKLGLIDWNNIKNSNVSVHYDSLTGTGKYILPQLLKDYGIPIHSVNSGKKTQPDPIDANLTELKTAVSKDKADLKIGISNDGDADRFGIVDENGKFITANDVLLLAAYHLSKNKGKKGTIIRSHATSSQIDLFAKKNGIDVIQTPVGFKFLGDEIEKLREQGKDVLVAGEESGGLTVAGHIPEKDGIVADLLMVDLVATEKKPLSEILKDAKKSIGTEFRAELVKKKVGSKVEQNQLMKNIENVYEKALKGNTELGNFIIDVEATQKNREKMLESMPDGDGIKLYFTDGSSILIRKSGTELLVKAYIETFNDDAKVADQNVIDLKQEIDKILTV